MKHPTTTGIFDSDTGESLGIAKIVDLGLENRYGDKVLLVYTQAQRGTIVMLWEEGRQIHFFVNELEQELLTKDRVWEREAERLGMTGEELKRLVETHRPKKEP